MRRSPLACTRMCCRPRATSKSQGVNEESLAGTLPMRELLDVLFRCLCQCASLPSHPPPKLLPIKARISCCVCGSASCALPLWTVMMFRAQLATTGRGREERTIAADGYCLSSGEPGTTFFFFRKPLSSVFSPWTQHPTSEDHLTKDSLEEEHCAPSLKICPTSFGKAKPR